MNSQGLIQIPSMQLPPSSYMSTEARQALVSKNFNPPQLREVMNQSDVAMLRAGMNTWLFEPMLEKALNRYAVTIRFDVIRGVPVSIVEPALGISSENRHRVLINLHGGFFTVGSGQAGLLESIPLACLQGIAVVSLDYRLGPEHRFPSASQDVSDVYRHLLQAYRPANIGIFGASAGGMLTAMALAWLQEEQLPMPGAVALLSAGATASMAGDSQFIGPASMGESIPPLTPDFPVMPVAYLTDTTADNPLVAPVFDPAVLSNFPPTLLMTGTRAFDMSSVVHTHRCLLRAGAAAELQLWEGLWHCFFYDTDLPESAEAYSTMANFFSGKLGTHDETSSLTQ